jgi:hypothetical protein
MTGTAEAEKSMVFGAVIKQRLVKTQQTENLVLAVVIC